MGLILGPIGSDLQADRMEVLWRVALVVIALPFLGGQARALIYPQLGDGRYALRYDEPRLAAPAADAAADGSST